jgi:hypothetical protein
MDIRSKTFFNLKLRLPYALIAFTCFSFSFEAISQGIKGFVVNSKGEPIPYVSIYAQPAKLGANSNVDGSFLLNLPKGIYEISFSSIDFKPKVIRVEVSDQLSDLKVVLEEQSYQLNEVKVQVNDIDPAVYIMRKAIGAAPYYKRQILKYSAKIYIKGSGSIDYVPKLMKGMVEESTEMQVGKTYVTESFNEVAFFQPNTYREKVISMQSTMPFKEGPEPMRMVRGSIYNTDYTGVISPLSSQAFSVYNFYLEGSFYENGREVNKIRIEPKRKGSDLYTGFLYVIEKLWCLHSCVLNNVSNGVNSSVKITFKQLAEQPLVWLPNTYDLSFKGNFLGIKGGFRYLGAVSNYKVTLNPNLNHDWLQLATKEMLEVQITQKPSQLKSKNQTKIEALVAKENLNKRVMVQLASRLKRESERSLNKNAIVYDSTELVIDSLAFKKDSAFWIENRPVPLMYSEQISFLQKDSLLKNTIDTIPKPKKNAHKFNVFSFLWNGDSTNITSNHYLSFSSPIKGLSLNSVNGIFVNTYVSFGSKKITRTWRYLQTIHIPLQRNLVQSKGEFNWLFKPYKLGKFNLKAGVILQDYNRNGITPLEDIFQLLLLGNNYSKWYMNEFAEGSINYEVSNGLNLKMRMGYYHRYGLENQDFFKDREASKPYQPNRLPSNETLPNHESYQLGLGLSFRPYQTYRFKQNKKEYLKSNWPLFQINYQSGTAKKLQFQQLDFQVSQLFNPRHWVEIQYKLQAGYFLYNKGLYQSDKQYFAGNLSAITQGNYKERFQDLPYYLQASSQQYVSFHSNYAFKRLALKNLPYLNLSNFKEALYFNVLKSDIHPLFFEAGYRVTELLRFFSFGLNQTFYEGKPKNLTFRININI